MRGRRGNGRRLGSDKVDGHPVLLKNGPDIGMLHAEGGDILYHGFDDIFRLLHGAVLIIQLGTLKGEDPVLLKDKNIETNAGDQKGRGKNQDGGPDAFR